MHRRIFLSYAHDEHVALARRIKSDEARGHEVWIDEECLSPGEDWEIGIERGIDWVSSDLIVGRVVILMTPHAARRPNGYCLNELSRTIGRGLPIVPIMVVWCEPPLSIDRIQWLDLPDSVAVETGSASYGDKVACLARALENDTIDSEGEQSRLLKELNPLPFDAEIHEHLERFIGRKFEAING